MIDTPRAYLIPRFPFDGLGFNKDFDLWDMGLTMIYSVALGVLGAYGSLNVKWAPFKAHRINVAYGCLLGGVIVYPLIAGISAFVKPKDSDQTVPSPTDQAIKGIEKASSASLGKSILEGIDTFAKNHAISLEETTSLKNTVQAAIDSQVSQLAGEVKKACTNDDLKRAIEEVVKTQLSSQSRAVLDEVQKLAVSLAEINQKIPAITGDEGTNQGMLAKVNENVENMGISLGNLIKKVDRLEKKIVPQ